jgi:hypothetical protein
LRVKFQGQLKAEYQTPNTYAPADLLCAGKAHEIWVMSQNDLEDAMELSIPPYEAAECIVTR